MVESEYDAAAERTEIHSQIVFVKRLVDEFCVDACQYRGRRVDGRECQSLAVGNRRIILQDFRDIIRIGRSLGRYGDGGALGLGDAAVVGDCQRNRVVARFQLDELKVELSSLTKKLLLVQRAWMRSHSLLSLMAHS